MTLGPEITEALDAVGATLTDASAATFEHDPRSTIVPLTLRPRARVRIDRDLELSGTLGEGGMGIVRRGVQRSLDREVAIKGLKPEHANERSISKLVCEARVTGGLEHPNVVPVYDIATHTDGTPLIVLKKIEGVDWSVLMHDADAVRERFGTDDLLDWNLRVLVHVCNATRFAHSRGVLHRDLKPENVMIGAFGEVYVLDWGIAVALDERAEDRLPRAAEALDMAGTPVYMAPEMLGGKTSRLSERTDVYLIGAILYEIVSGSPPHAASNLGEILASIAASSPEIPADVPEELQRIISRALDADPDARFEKVEQVRLAIEAFLRHRSATRIARRAEERLAELLDRLGRPGSIEDVEPIHRLYGECRFGLRHALEVWPENESARRSLELATTRMVELELARDDPQAARTLLRDLAAVPPELEARVAEASAHKEREWGELRRLREYFDPGAGRSVRRVAEATMAGVWILWPLAVELVRRFVPRLFNAGAATVCAALVFALTLGVLFWARRIVSITIFNRRLSLTIGLSAFTALVLNFGAYVSGGSLLGAVHDMLLAAMAIVAALASGSHRGLFVPAIGYLIGYLAALAFGLDLVFYITSAANLVLFITLFTVLREWGHSMSSPLEPHTRRASPGA